MKSPASALLFSALITVTFSGVSYAGCDAPEEPQIPNAETTVTAEMVKAQNDVKQFMAAAENYLSCVNNSTKHNRMVNRMEEVAEDFNQVVRAFKAKNSKA